MYQVYISGCCFNSPSELMVTKYGIIRETDKLGVFFRYLLPKKIRNTQLCFKPGVTNGKRNNKYTIKIVGLVKKS